MTESDANELLERTLGQASPPLGCTEETGMANRFRSFWETLDAIAQFPSKSASVSQRDIQQRVFEGCKEDAARLQSLTSVSSAPILAVCGLLNSGKSSLVAGFLSAKGRQRVLVGLGDEEGTHRFVIWLPQSWQRNQALWTAVLEQIEQVFGGKSQPLSEDPNVARRQYNGQFKDSTLEESNQGRIEGDAFKNPLIATDPMLDELGVGLMDCPDIQSGIFGNDDSADETVNFRHLQHVADERARLLLKGLRIASGLVVVAQSNSIREIALQHLIQCAHAAMPNTRLFVAVNRVPKKYSPAEIDSEVTRHYMRYHPHGIYMAYDFRGPDSVGRIPPAPPQWKDSPDHQLPLFFDVKSSPTGTSNKSWIADDYLVSIGAKLDTNQLARELLCSTLGRFIANLKACEKSIQQAIDLGQKRLSRVHQTFSEAIIQFAAVEADSSKVRLQMSHEIIEQVRRSLERTAPWWAKPSQRIGRWSSNLNASAKDLTDKIPGLPSVSKKLNQSAEWIRSKIRSGQGGSIMTAIQLATSLRRSDATGELSAANSYDQDSLVAIAENIIVRFQKESHAKLDDTALDQGTSLLWKKMSWKQKLVTGAAPATLIFAPIIAVVTIPIDFGTTHVLVFATVKELLLAGVASAGIFLLQSDQFPELAESQAAWQQISDLFAITCDEFGCSRPQQSQLPMIQVGKELKQILSSATQTCTALPSSLAPVLQYQPDFQKRFHQLLQALEFRHQTLLNHG